MAYTITNVYALDPTYTGASLRAQLYSSTNVAVGSAISTGFYERAGAQGVFAHAMSVPDDHVGWCDVYDNASPGVVLVSFPINPRELEYSDQKSSLLAPAATALSTSQWTNVRAALLDYLDASINSRLASASYTAPDNASIASILTQIGVAGAGLTALPGMVWANSARTLSSFGTLLADLATAVWGAAERTLTAFGSNTLIEFTYTLTDSVTTLPLSGASIRISTDSGGNNTVWSGLTDAFGVARDAYGGKPRLAAGTYYIWRSLSGYTFSDPDVEVANA